MKTQFLKLSVTGIFFFTVADPILGMQATVSDSLVYVWEFSTEDSSIIDLPARLTEEFETALTQVEGLFVLERRRYDRLVAHRANEKAIMKIEEIPQSTLDSLKSLKASIVIFGEVDDDVESGEIKVTVIFQNFDGRKKKWSTRFPRGKRYDAGSREHAMKLLVRKIFPQKASSQNERQDVFQSKELPSNLKFSVSVSTSNAEYDDRGVHISLEYFLPWKLKTSLGVEAGSLTRKLTRTYKTLSGLPETTLDFTITDDYLGGLFKVFPLSIEHLRTFPFIGATFGMPVNSQLVIGSNFRFSRRLTLGVEFRLIYYKSDNFSVDFNEYGDAEKLLLPKNIFRSALGFNLGFLF